MGRTRSPAFSALLLPLALATTACGMKPYQNPNHREEGSGQGLFTGPEGQWLIYRKVQSAPRTEATPAANDRGDDGPASFQTPPSLK